MEGRERHPRKRGWIATERDAQLARAALRQLRSERLTVSLVPAPRPQHQSHSIRVVEQENPPWYQELAARRPRSNSIRGYVLASLERIADGYIGPSPWSMDVEVLEVLEEHAGDLDHVEPACRNMPDHAASLRVSIASSLRSLPALLTIGTVARQLCVDRRTVERYLERGQLHGVKLGAGRVGARRIPRDELERFLLRRLDDAQSA